jgi:predicted permease
MPNYSQVIQVGVSMLFTILVGFATCRFRWLSFDSVAPVNRFLLYVAYVPLIMRSSASRSLSEISFLPFAIGACASATLFVTFAIFFLIPFHDHFYMYLSTLLPSVYVNYVIVGIPIFHAICGHDGDWTVPVITLSNDLVTLPAYLVLSNIYSIRRANREHIAAHDGLEEKFSFRILGSVLLHLLTNPIVIGNVAGFCYAAAKLPMFPFLKNVLDYFGNAVLPLSLWKS